MEVLEQSKIDDDVALRSAAADQRIPSAGGSTGSGW
jgi:hypothetical protein